MGSECVIPDCGYDIIFGVGIMAGIIGFLIGVVVSDLCHLLEKKNG